MVDYSKTIFHSIRIYVITPYVYHETVDKTQPGDKRGVYTRYVITISYNSH